MAWRDDPSELVQVVGRFVREVGFPVVVACYLLFRADGLLVDLVRDTGDTVRLLRELNARPAGCVKPGCSRDGARVLERRPRVLEVDGGAVGLPPGAPSPFRALTGRQPVPWR